MAILRPWRDDRGTSLMHCWCGQRWSKRFQSYPNRQLQPIQIKILAPKIGTICVVAIPGTNLHKIQATNHAAKPIPPLAQAINMVLTSGASSESSLASPLIPMVGLLVPRKKMRRLAIAPCAFRRAKAGRLALSFSRHESTCIFAEAAVLRLAGFAIMLATHGKNMMA